MALFVLTANVFAVYYYRQGIVEILVPENQAQHDNSDDRQSVKALLEQRNQNRRASKMPMSYMAGSAQTQFDVKSDRWQMRSFVDSDNSYICEIVRRFGHGTLTLRSRHVYSDAGKDFSRRLSMTLSHKQLPERFAMADALLNVDGMEMRHTSVVHRGRVFMDIDAASERLLREGYQLRVQLMRLRLDTRPRLKTLEHGLRIRNPYKLKSSKRAMAALGACSEHPMLDDVFYAIAA